MNVGVVGRWFMGRLDRGGVMGNVYIQNDGYLLLIT